MRPTSIVAFVKEQGGRVPPELTELSDKISRTGGTPLAVADGARLLGIIHLKDIVKVGMKERIAQLRAMGIRSVMVTGDNPLTAAAIASEAGVDDFIAQATPKDKLEYIKKEQAGGRMIAMTGDGTNDAPALAQADVGLAMNTGTTAAREAGNMVDLDSNPTKLIEVVAIGKQLLITRGALTTFSIMNDVSKYFAIIPAMFMTTYPALGEAEHHVPADAGERGARGRDLQRRDHRRARAAGVAGCPVPAAERRADAAPQSDDLRRRRADRAVPVHLGDRPHSGLAASGVVPGAEQRRRQRQAGGPEISIMLKELKAGFLMMVVMTVMTGVRLPRRDHRHRAGASFPDQANGSLITLERAGDRARVCIGQNFTKPEYFHPRPSSAGSSGYDPTASAGSNLGPTSAKLLNGRDQHRRQRQGVGRVRRHQDADRALLRRQ